MDHDRILMRQRLIAALVPLETGYALDLQSRFEAPSGPITLGKTNFGFLGVRVTKTLSEQFGGGHLTNAEGTRESRRSLANPVAGSIIPAPRSPMSSRASPTSTTPRTRTTPPTGTSAGMDGSAPPSASKSPGASPPTTRWTSATASGCIPAPPMRMPLTAPG